MTITIEGIPIEIERKMIRSMRLIVYPPDARVRLRIPLFTREETAYAFIRQKWQWICHTREKILTRAQESPHAYISGETFYLLGVPYTLQIEPIAHGINSVAIEGEQIVMRCRPSTTMENQKRLMQEWYRQELRKAIEPLMAKWMAELQQTGITWTIKVMKRAWGNCRPTQRRIAFNLDLARYPIACIEYIVVHEMTHLDVPNHSQAFKALMTERLPHWKELRKQLASPLKQGA